MKLLPKTGFVMFPTQHLSISRKIAMVLGLIFLLFFVLACNTSNSSVKAVSVPKELLLFPYANYDDIVWINQKLFAFKQLAGPIQYVGEGGTSLENFELPQDSSCREWISYVLYDNLPDGHLQFRKDCQVDNTPAKAFVMAYDWNTKEMEQIADTLPLGTKWVSMNPEMTKGVAFLSNSFDTTLYWVWANGHGPMDLTITNEGKSWNLKNFYPDFPSLEESRTGNAERATWSPDGNFIAFFASSDAMGKGGLDRLSNKSNLYIMDVKTLQPVSVMTGVYSPDRIIWSPDSKHLIFTAYISKEQSLFLYTLATRSAVIIDKGSFAFGDYLWHYDDVNTLFVLRCDGLSECHEVYKYDLTNIVK